MAYDLILSPKAVDTIERQPYPIQQVIRNHLDHLAEDPVHLSRPSAPPAEMPGYQLYEFDCNYEGIKHTFKVFFHYGQDEQSLHVYLIGHIEYDIPF